VAFSEHFWSFLVENKNINQNGSSLSFKCERTKNAYKNDKQTKKLYQTRSKKKIILSPNNKYYIIFHRYINLWYFA